MTAARVPLHHADDAAGAVRPAGAHRPVGVAAPTTGWATSTSRAAPTRSSSRRRRPTSSPSSPTVTPTTCCRRCALARDCPLLVAPAMNRQMWANAANQRNVAQLVADGVIVLGPGSGDQACGETGEGRMLEPEEIFAAVVAWRAAEAARRQARAADRRADVRGDRPGARHHQFELGQDGLRARAGGRRGRRDRDAGQRADARCRRRRASTRIDVRERRARWPTRSTRSVAGADVFIAVAAVADYTPAAAARAEDQEERRAADDRAASRPSTSSRPSRRGRDAPYCVGFAAESHDVDATPRKSAGARSCR